MREVITSHRARMFVLRVVCFSCARVCLASLIFRVRVSYEEEKSSLSLSLLLLTFLSLCK